MALREDPRYSEQGFDDAMMGVKEETRYCPKQDKATKKQVRSRVQMSQADVKNYHKAYLEIDDIHKIASIKLDEEQLNDLIYTDELYEDAMSAMEAKLHMKDLESNVDLLYEDNSVD